MRVRADLSDVSVELGNKGIVFQIAEEDGTPLGRLRVGKATAEWIPANGKMGHGHKAPIRKFISALETMPRGRG